MVEVLGRKFYQCRA